MLALTAAMRLGLPIATFCTVACLMVTIVMCDILARATRYSDAIQSCDIVQRPKSCYATPCLVYYVVLVLDITSRYITHQLMQSIVSLHHHYLSHRWNRTPRPQPQTFSKLVFILYFSSCYIFLNRSSGAPVGVRGSDFIG